MAAKAKGSKCVARSGRANTKARYAGQFSRTWTNKVRRFKRHHPDGNGTIPKARYSKQGQRETVV